MGLTPLRLVASAAGLHARDPFAAGPPATPEVWWCDFSGPALALGSAQSPDVVDHAACRADGVEVVRRRSGGGAVLLRPGATVWIDLVLPAGWWSDDVRASMVAAGELWRDVLIELGWVDPARLVVHTGGMVATDWSSLVCFAGVGPGEVLDVSGPEPRKLVGLSQRRTRLGVRVQGMVHAGPAVADTARYLTRASWPTGSELAEQGVVAGVSAERLAERLAIRMTPV